MTAVSRRYEALLASDELKPDADQAQAVAVLDRLAADLHRQEKPGLFSRLFGAKPNGHRGVYMWGGVGRGKSMLMDLAFETIAISPKRSEARRGGKECVSTCRSRRSQYNY